MKENSLAILYIALGKYSVFWNNFFKSCEQYFCKELEKEYFIFSDNLDGLDNLDERIKFYQQDNLGWPCSTLMRYHMFSRAKDLLKEYKYICYFNANTLFIQTINADEFFGNARNELIGGLHPGYKNQSKDKYPFERRESSNAFTRNKNYYLYLRSSGKRSPRLCGRCYDIK